jgi:hypothetical protein
MASRVTLALWIRLRKRVLDLGRSLTCPRMRPSVRTRVPRGVRAVANLKDGLECRIVPVVDGERYHRAQEFNDIGSLLYGPHWQSHLARVLGVSDRTIRRWSSGDPVPDNLRETLALICDDKRRNLARALRWLKHPDTRFSNTEHKRNLPSKLEMRERSEEFEGEI